MANYVDTITITSIFALSLAALKQIVKINNSVGFFVWERDLFEILK